MQRTQWKNVTTHVKSITQGRSAIVIFNLNTPISYILYPYTRDYNDISRSEPHNTRIVRIYIIVVHTGRVASIGSNGSSKANVHSLS